MIEEFKSRFASYIKRFIQYKKSLGYKYESEIQVLKRFDVFCFDNYPSKDILDKDIMMKWASRNENEKSKTLSNRIHIINQLSRFISGEGWMETFVIPSYCIPKKTPYTPYIFSDDEVARIFNVIDNNCHYCYEVPYRQDVLPIFFRTLYCCGLRVTEARLLRVCDVDLEKGVLTLYLQRMEKKGKFHYLTLFIRNTKNMLKKF